MEMVLIFYARSPMSPWSHGWHCCMFCVHPIKCFLTFYGTVTPCVPWFTPAFTPITMSPLSNCWHRPVLNVAMVSWLTWSGLIFKSNLVETLINYNGGTTTFILYVIHHSVPTTEQPFSIKGCPPFCMRSSLLKMSFTDSASTRRHLPFQFGRHHEPLRDWWWNDDFPIEPKFKNVTSNSSACYAHRFF